MSLRSLKTSDLSADNLKKKRDFDGSTLEPAIRDFGQRVLGFDSCQLITKLMSIVCALSVFLCYVLARKFEIEHCSRSSKTINWSSDRFLINHVTLTHELAIWSWDTGQWLSCFDSCKLTILWMTYIKYVDLPRHAWDTPPFLLIASPTPPVQSVDAYAWSFTWQPNEKRLTIFHEYGPCPTRASRAREPRYKVIKKWFGSKE